MAIRILKDGETFVVRDVDLPDVFDGDPDVTYTLRPLSRAKMAELLEANTTRTLNPKTRAMDKVVDQVALMEACLDFCLVGWTGYVSDGQPVPCTREWRLVGLEPVRSKALLDIATSARRDEATRESFRPTA